MEERTDGSVTISLRNFVGEGIIKVLFPQAMTLADLAILYFCGSRSVQSSRLHQRHTSKGKCPDKVVKT
jgi:hypothetical protein